METIDLISNVGFPIAAFLLMFWQNTKVINKNTEAMNELILYLKSREGLKT